VTQDIEDRFRKFYNNIDRRIKRQNMTTMRCDRLTTTNLQLAKGQKKEPRQNQKKKKKTVSLPTSTQTNTKGDEIWRSGGMTTTSLCPPPSKNEEDTKKMRKKKK
jgi:hypothetical protein